MKVYLHLAEDQDLEKAYTLTQKWEGVSYLGLGEGMAVFELSTDYKKFVGRLVALGVRVMEAVIQTPHGLIGMTPVAARCEGCGEKFAFSDIHSRQSKNLCDGCLSRQIEIPIEKGEDA